MKRLFLMIIIAGLMTPAELMAQKVYKDVINRVILESTKATGMPVGGFTSEAKAWTGSPSNEAGPMLNNKADESINATVYQKLEIAPNDLTATTEEGVTTYYVDGSGSTSTFYWADAFDGCRAVGGSWRLPTQRELMLIYIFRPALEPTLAEINGTAAFVANNYYWSATEYSAGNSWYVSFSNGNNRGATERLYSKESSYRVRCVREVK